MSSLIIVINTLLFFTVALYAIDDIKDTQFRIYGGKGTTIEEAPFMAIYISVKSNSHDNSHTQYKCGASILTDTFVVSAAHCYVQEAIQSYIIVGTDQFGVGTRFGIKKTTVHPQYNKETYDYDVLVVKLIEKLTFSARVQPIKMADSNLVIRDGAILDVFGFGVTENGYGSKRLRRLRVLYISQEKCKLTRHIFYATLTDTMICAGENRKTVCPGDSGGPLVYENVLVGVASLGTTCGLTDYLPGFPGVYTSVARVKEFVDSVIKRI